MFTRSEIKKMKKGFYPSRIGKSPEATVGKGTQYGNRKHRRIGLTEDRSLRGKSKMIVYGRNRFITFDQFIPSGIISSKGKAVVIPARWVNHYILISKPNV